MLPSLPALKRAEARAPERGVYAASATIVFGSVEFFMRVYAGGTKRHEEKQTGEGERWHGAGKFQCCICRPRFFVFRFGAVRQPISVVLPKHGRMFLPPWGRGLGWVARIDMGNTLSTHMGNTSIFVGRSLQSHKNCYTLRRKPLKAQLTGFATKCVVVRLHAKSALQADAERRKCYPCLCSLCYPCLCAVP